MVGFIAFIAVLSLLIFAHELGHFSLAKLFGVQVGEFGFGYPPRLLKLGSWRETTITLNALPFGGFVRMAENDPTVPGGLASRGRGTRALVFAGGAIMNAILAVVLFSTTFVLGTLVPAEIPGAGIYYVAPGSPAEIGGIRVGDNIVAIDGQPIANAAAASALIKSKVGQPIQLVMQRNGRQLPALSVTPRVSPPPNEGALGIALDLPLVTKSYSVWQAVPLGVRSTYNAVATVVAYFRAVIHKEAPFQFSGVVGIYGATRQVAKSGLVRLVEFTGFLSIQLAIFQLFPLPALDGGHLLFVALEWLRGGRKVPPEKEGLVHAIGMVVLLGLMVIVSVFDYMRYFG